jgi:hypothetical protein
MLKLTTAACALLTLLGSGPAGAAQIKGDYIESRTADIFTGPCFSNAEVFITGHQAVMAWKVTEGSWDGVDLKGLSVAAALKGNTTFSEDRPKETHSVLIIDERANARQREALIAFAKHMAGDRLNNVVDVRSALINVTVEAHDDATQPQKHSLHNAPHAPRASFWAAGLAAIVTRPLDDGDHFCGNETVAYAPLSNGVEVLPAYTLDHSFKGKGLDSTWRDANCRSSFVGRFSN